MTTRPNIAEGEPDIRDVALQLLTAAIVASHFTDQLIHLAARYPASDSTALHDITDAITTMEQVRSHLVHDADRLIDTYDPAPPNRDV